MTTTTTYITPPKAYHLRFNTHTSVLQLAANLAIFFLLITPTIYARPQSPNRNTEADEANIKDPNTECTSYYYAPVYSRRSSFPNIWQGATILSGDSNAQAKWAAIRGSVPNISIKGTPSGDFSKFTYSPSDDDCWWTFSKCVSPKMKGLPMDIADVPEPHTLGFGFDDGPNCSHNAFYDYLSSQNQKATMFYIGSNVLDWPLEAQRGVTDGHEICVHTWSHKYMTALSSADAFAELYYSHSPAIQMQAIKLVTDVTPTCWRPPFGDVDDRIRAIANGLGLQTILWKYDSNDWRAGTPGITADTVDADYQAVLDTSASGGFDRVGAIILTHELNNFTMGEAVKFYPKLKAAFKNVVPVGVALNKSRPYVEDGHSLPTFAEYVQGLSSTSTPDPSSGVSGGVNADSPPADSDGGSGAVPGSTSGVDDEGDGGSGNGLNGNGTSESDVQGTASTTKKVSSGAIGSQRWQGSYAGVGRGKGDVILSVFVGVAIRAAVFLVGF